MDVVVIYTQQKCQDTAAQAIAENKDAENLNLW